MELMGKRPLEISQDFIVQYAWFCGRVRLLLAGGNVVERLGNS
jgi:hypothetical protein